MLRGRIGVPKALSDIAMLKILSAVMEHDLLGHTDLSIASGCTWLVGEIIYVRPHLVSDSLSAGTIDAVWAVYRRVCPSPLSAEWWSSTSAVVDIKTAQLCHPIFVFMVVLRTIDGDTYASHSWFSPYLQEMIYAVKANHLEGLSARDTGRILHRVDAHGAHLCDTKL